MTNRVDLLLSRRAERIADELDRSATDGWLLFDFRGANPAFRRLLGDDQHPQSTRRAFLYVPRHGEPHLVIHHVDAGNFARLGVSVTPYGGRAEMRAQLSALLGGARRVLMEYSPGNAIPYVSRVDGGTLDMVRSLGVEVVSSADALASVVAAWDAEDLASHERAAQALDRARDGLYTTLRDRLARGITCSEYDAQQHLAALMRAEGLEYDHPPIVAVGPHTADPHYAPEPEVALPIRPGDLLLTDLWGHEANRADGGLGAFADITWMATAASDPEPEQVRVWETVRDARDAAVRYLETRLERGEAVQGGQVDAAARTVIDAAGFGAAFTHRTGHSIGWLSAHGDGVNIDDFETHDTRLLRPGAAFSIEPGIYLGPFGVRSEINVAIAPDGTLKVTTPPQQALVKLV
jgi:Xaa-Pro aminopeptidase